MSKFYFRKTIRMVGLGIMIAAFTVISGFPTTQASSKKPILLKLSNWLPEMGTEGKMGKWWGSELEKRSNGRVKIDYYFAQALVKTMDSLPAVSTG